MIKNTSRFHFFKDLKILVYWSWKINYSSVFPRVVVKNIKIWGYMGINFNFPMTAHLYRRSQAYREKIFKNRWCKMIQSFILPFLINLSNTDVSVLNEKLIRICTWEQKNIKIRKSYNRHHIVIRLSLFTFSINIFYYYYITHSKLDNNNSVIYMTKYKIS